MQQVDNLKIREQTNKSLLYILISSQCELSLDQTAVNV